MLTPRQNFEEVLKGGNPDRYVNQYEYMQIIGGAPIRDFTLDDEGCMTDEWGVTYLVKGQPGRIPVHDAQHLVVDDITTWRDVVKSPANLWDDPAVWEKKIEQAEAVDTSQVFRASSVAPGIYERLHSLHEMTRTLMDMFDHPQETKDLIKAITENELKQAEAICKYIKPEIIFHHDDWGSASSTMFSPDMFEEFLLEPGKEVYGYYKDHGCKYVVHHSDSYAASLVPYMIEMGIDVWQGALLESNNIPELIEKYGDKITIMGGIENQYVDTLDWTPESVDAAVDKCLDTVKSKVHFIPCLTMGAAQSLNKGVYDQVSKRIDERSKIDFA